MTTLAIDTPRVYELGDLNDIPVIANEIIYEGSAVGSSSGYARPLVAADVFLGFAIQNCDNSLGGAGAEMVKVQVRGQIQLAVASVAITSIGLAVYAIDDNNFTLTATSNSLIGKVKRFISSGICIVDFDALP
jgi:hypothetical protein